MKQVQRWTGVVSANDNGGFVAYGDYLELQAENERLDKENTDSLVSLATAIQHQDGFRKQLNYLRHEMDDLKAEYSNLQAERDALAAELSTLKAQENIK